MMILAQVVNNFSTSHERFKQCSEKQNCEMSVSCLFGHYPSSQFLNKITTFQRLALSPSSGDKGKGKREVILAGGSLRQS